MKTATEIKAELPNFYGTENWYRYSPLFKTILLTDGAKYIADECEAYWLMDVIGSYLPKIKGGFAVAKLTVADNKGRFTLADDDPAGKTFAKQTIEYTDFPLDEIKFYVINDGTDWVILLPSEY